MLQKQSRLSPVALHGALRRSAELGDLREREPAEEVQIHQLGERRIEQRELLDRIAEPFQLLRSSHGVVRRLFIASESDLELAPAFERTPAPRVRARSLPSTGALSRPMRRCPSPIRWRVISRVAAWLSKPMLGWRRAGSVPQVST